MTSDDVTSVSVSIDSGSDPWQKRGTSGTASHGSIFISALVVRAVSLIVPRLGEGSLSWLYTQYSRLSAEKIGFVDRGSVPHFLVG